MRFACIAKNRHIWPDFVAMKMQKLELRACAARVHGPARPGRNYGINEIFHREMELVAQAESAYA